MGFSDLCGAISNAISFIFLLIATIGAFWVWGYATYGGIYAEASMGIWVAGQIFNGEFPVPCGCNPLNGSCAGFCYASHYPVEWLYITPEQVCAPLSQVFLKWSGPLGYCKFPAGFNITAPPKHNRSDDYTWVGDYRAPPAGTQFIVPSQIPATQGLMTTATILVFFALVLGGVGKSKPAAFLSTCVWVFTLAAYCLWSTFPYVTKLNDFEVWMPVYSETGDIVVVPMSRTYQPDYGSSFGLAIAASVMSFISCLAHLKGANESEDEEEKPAAEKPAAAPAPAPAAAATAPPPAAPAPAAQAPGQQITTV